MADQIPKLPSKIDATSARFEKNMRAMATLVSEIRTEEEQIRQGGGEKAIESQHAKKRLTARERINLLIDRDTEFFELGLYAAYEMYEEWGGAPSAGDVSASAPSSNVAPRQENRYRQPRLEPRDMA